MKNKQAIRSRYGRGQRRSLIKDPYYRQTALISAPALPGLGLFGHDIDVDVRFDISSKKVAARLASMLCRQ